MSEQEFRVEKCGGLIVYHPIQKQAEVIALPRREDWDTTYAEHLRWLRAA